MATTCQGRRYVPCVATIDARGSQHKITMEEIEELHAEQHGEERIDGKPCICVSSSFRAVQLAFSMLWRENDEIPNELAERVKEKG